jgi:hypothetical protein
LVDVGIVEYNEGGVAPGLERYSILTFSDVSIKRDRTNFLRVEAAIPASNLATGVEPVKVTFFTVLLSHISFPTSPTFLRVVTTLITPSGTPARRAS